MYFKSCHAYFISSNFFIHMVLLSVLVNYNNLDLNCYYFLTIYSLTLHIKVRVKSKLTIPVFILLAHVAIFYGEQFIHARQSTKKNVFAFIIFNPNLKILLPSKMTGLL